MSTKIQSIDRGSPAEQYGIAVGETLLSLNGHEIVDVLDYRYYGYDAVLEVALSSKGKERTVTLEKEEGEDLGLNFDTYLIDQPRPCSNHCIFCFVDQMPPDMRKSLYFKDDDARLSFLMGNYITLTNLSEREAQRIIDLHISPINISVQATEPQLRRTLLGNKNADKSMEYMRAFGLSDIEMNGQIVVCPGWNDGEHLKRTIEDLIEIGFHSCSVVPVGLTQFRKGLAAIKPIDEKTANEIIDTVDHYGKICMKKFGSRTFFCADELYILAKRPLPPAEYYEDYQQLENGVGMLRNTMDEFLLALADQKEWNATSFTVATGAAAAPFIEQLLIAAKKRFPNLDGEVVEIENRFFGTSITVSGLLTGRDIAEQLRERVKIKSRVILPSNMLRHGGDVFLDDMTPNELSQKINRPVFFSETDGYALCDTIFAKE